MRCHFPSIKPSHHTGDDKQLERFRDKDDGKTGGNDISPWPDDTKRSLCAANGKIRRNRNAEIGKNFAENNQAKGKNRSENGSDGLTCRHPSDGGVVQST